MLLLRRIYAAGLAFGLLVNGYLYLAWFREPPNPDRVGYWFMLFLFVLPALGLIACFTLFQARSLRLALPVLIYVTLALIIANQPWLFAWVFPWIAFEQLYVLLWLITIVAFVRASLPVLWGGQASTAEQDRHAHRWEPSPDVQTRWRRTGGDPTNRDGMR